MYTPRPPFRPPGTPPTPLTGVPVEEAGEEEAGGSRMSACRRVYNSLRWVAGRGCSAPWSWELGAAEGMRGRSLRDESLVVSTGVVWGW